MSKLQTELEHYISDFSADGSKLTASFVIPKSFVGFDGHFAEMPVLPGICLIQMTVVTASRSFKAVVLKNVKLAKFFTPVFPEEKLDFAITVKELEANTAMLKTVVTRGGDKIAQTSCTIEYGVKL